MENQNAPENNDNRDLAAEISRILSQSRSIKTGGDIISGNNVSGIGISVGRNSTNMTNVPPEVMMKQLEIEEERRKKEEKKLKKKQKKAKKKAAEAAQAVPAPTETVDEAPAPVAEPTEIPETQGPAPSFEVVQETGQTVEWVIGGNGNNVYLVDIGPDDMAAQDTGVSFVEFPGFETNPFDTLVVGTEDLDAVELSGSSQEDESEDTLDETRTEFVEFKWPEDPDRDAQAELQDGDGFVQIQDWIDEGRGDNDVDFGDGDDTSQEISAPQRLTADDFGGGEGLPWQDETEAGLELIAADEDQSERDTEWSDRLNVKKNYLAQVENRTDIVQAFLEDMHVADIEETLFTFYDFLRFMNEALPRVDILRGTEMDTLDLVEALPLRNYQYQNVRIDALCLRILTELTAAGMMGGEVLSHIRENTSPEFQQAFENQTLQGLRQAELSAPVETFVSTPDERLQDGEPTGDWTDAFESDAAAAEYFADLEEAVQTEIETRGNWQSAPDYPGDADAAAYFEAQAQSQADALSEEVETTGRVGEVLPDESEVLPLSNAEDAINYFTQAFDNPPYILSETSIQWLNNLDNQGAIAVIIVRSIENIDLQNLQQDSLGVLRAACELLFEAPKYQFELGGRARTILKRAARDMALPEYILDSSMVAGALSLLDQFKELAKGSDTTPDPETLIEFKEALSKFLRRDYDAIAPESQETNGEEL